MVDNFTLAYLNISQTKERLARDELSATTKIEKFGKYIYSPNITAVVYVQPTQVNVDQIAENISRDKKSFNEMHIIFTNEPTDEQLEQLAKADGTHHKIIYSVRVFYGEFYPIAENLLLSSTNTIDSLGDFIKKYDVMPYAIRYQGSSPSTQAFAESLYKDLQTRQFKFDFQGKCPKTRPKAPIQVVITDRQSNMVDVASIFFSFQALINELYKPGCSGMVNSLTHPGQMIPFAYFTADNTTKLFYNIDLFNAKDKIAQLRERQINISKQKIDPNDMKQVSEFLGKQAEMKAAETEVVNLLDIMSGVTHSPLVKMYMDYVLGASAFLSAADKVTLNDQMKSVVDAITGSRNARSAEELESMIRLACQMVLGYSVLDKFIPKPARKEPIPEFRPKDYLKLIRESVAVDNVVLNEYVDDTKKAVEKLAGFAQRNDWNNVQNCVAPALKFAVQREIYLNVPRPEFLMMLEESDIRQVQRRYQRRPNIVALADLCLCKQLPKQDFGCVKEMWQTMEQINMDPSVPAPVTLIYQIGGVTAGEASALINFEYYAKFGIYGNDIDNQCYEIGRLLNNRVILMSDKILTFQDWANSMIMSEKPVQQNQAPNSVQDALNSE